MTLTIHIFTTPSGDDKELPSTFQSSHRLTKGMDVGVTVRHVYGAAFEKLESLLADEPTETED